MQKKLAVLFGGKSPEHEVSIITAVQLMKHVDTARYEVVPMYVDKKGTWWTGDQLQDISTFQKLNLTDPKGLISLASLPELLALFSEAKSQIEVAILCFHGAYGEAGNVQAVLELAGIPYQGPGVTSSAVAFDKIMTRQILAAENIHQTKFVWFTTQEWQDQQKECAHRVSELGYPVYVKPANGGSTIGIQRVTSAAELPAVIAAVGHYDQRILVEKEVTDCIEVNVSVVGLEGEVQASVPEQPLKKDEFLSFADKYERGGKKSGMASASRRIPAPISQNLTDTLQRVAKHIFHIFDCSGVVRIDFFVNPSTEEILVTEINTIPGSMSYYLWEASGVKYPQLIDKLVDIAEKRFSQKQRLITTFETNILQKAQI